MENLEQWIGWFMAVGAALCALVIAYDLFNPEK